MRYQLRLADLDRRARRRSASAGAAHLGQAAGGPGCWPVRVAAGETPGSVEGDRRRGRARSSSTQAVMRAWVGTVGQRAPRLDARRAPSRRRARSRAAARGPSAAYTCQSRAALQSGELPQPVLVADLPVPSRLAEDRQRVEVRLGDARDGEVDRAETGQRLPQRERVALHRAAGSHGPSARATSCAASRSGAWSGRARLSGRARRPAGGAGQPLPVAVRRPPSALGPPRVRLSPCTVGRGGRVAAHPQG